MEKRKKHEVVPASTLRKIRKDIEEIGGQRLVLNKLEKSVEKLTEKVELSIKTNIDLQEKVTELMLHITELVENMQKMTEFMGLGMVPIQQMPPEEELQKPQKKDISEQLRLLAEQNRELTQTLRSLEEQLKKGETKEAIRKALEKVKALK